MKGQGNFITFLLITLGIAILISAFMTILMVIGAVRVTDGCLYRYNFSDSYEDSFRSKFILRADGNYQASTFNSVAPPNYGQWYNTGVRVYSGRDVNLKITGKTSMCKSYVPANNLVSSSAQDVLGALVPVPRIEDSGDPLWLYFDAKKPVGFYNITNLVPADEVIVSIASEKNSAFSSLYDPFAKNNVSADCSEGKNSYSPICGKYSIYNGMNYTTGCYANNNCYWQKCGNTCRGYGSGWDIGYDAFGNCWGYETYDCENPPSASCLQTSQSSAPPLYKDDGTYNTPWTDDLTILDRRGSINPKCSGQIYGQDSKYCVGDCNNKNSSYSKGSKMQDYTYIAGMFGPVASCTPTDSGPNQDTYGIVNGTETNVNGIKCFVGNKFDQTPSNLYFWNSAKDVTGLLYKIDGYNSNFAAALSDQSAYGNNPNNKIIFNTTYQGTVPANLGYSYAVQGTTGGYVLGIKHTKCKRQNGMGFSNGGSGSDSADRGSVLYVIMDGDPNLSDPKDFKVIQTDKDGNASFKTAASGTVWMKISNYAPDYKDSTGTYTVESNTGGSSSGFVADILSPLLQTMRDKVDYVSSNMFQKLTCSGTYSSDTSSCTNFFTYVKVLLVLYVMVYGIMFLLGVTKIDQTSFLIHVVKIGFVAGLLNGSTFAFFKDYVFDFVIGFSDQIIANIAGYSLFSSGDSFSGAGAPFMFLDELMTRVFLTSTFTGQILSLVAMGLSGILYLIVVVTALITALSAIFKSIAVYCMAFFSIAFLLGLAPIFLTFMLFDFTKHIFDHWVRFTFKYALEPAVYLAGIIITTQLFTVYLDYVVGYSVCWKCAIPFKLPFPSIPGLNPALLNVELFCINWFAPWGYDNNSSGLMGMNMAHIAALFIIAHCMKGYHHLCTALMSSLTSTMAVSSAGSGLSMLDHIKNNPLDPNLDKEAKAMGYRNYAHMKKVQKDQEKKETQKRRIGNFLEKIGVTRESLKKMGWKKFPGDEKDERKAKEEKKDGEKKEEKNDENSRENKGKNDKGIKPLE